MNSRRPLDEDTLRRQLASAAELIDPQPPTREELNELRRVRRKHRTLRASAPLLVAAAVAAIAVVATAVAVRHRSAPRPPATPLPAPTTVSSTVPPPTSSTAPAPSHPATQSSPTTPASTTAAASQPPSSPTTNNLPLTAGQYGFLIPAGWHVHPLTNYGGSSSWASFTRDPAAAPLHAAGPNSVQYTVSGATGFLYTRDGKPVLSEAANSTLCPPTHWQPISSSAISFTCAPVSGMQPRGILIVEPSPNGTKELIVTMPGDEEATATQILDSFR